MTAKEYLGKIRTENIKIKQKLEQLEGLQQAATSTGVDLTGDKVQTTKKGSAPELAAKYLDLEKEIQADVERREQAKEDVIAVIHSLQDERQVKVLYEKWVNGRRVEDIANDFPYTEKHTWRIYTEAMKAVDRILGEEEP